MAPKGDERLRQALTPADRDTECEVQRLREMAEGVVLQKEVACVKKSRIPSSMRHADNADIVKRNSSQKKKYLFVFPGALSLPLSAKIGSLSGLNTRTPKLIIDVPGNGRMMLSGSLVFPKNSVITVRGPTKAGKPVQIVDTCETLVVFSEWAWVGKEEWNPGQIPERVPKGLQRENTEAEDLWQVKTDGADNTQQHERDRTGDATERRIADTLLSEQSSEQVSVARTSWKDDDSEIEWKGAGSVKTAANGERRTSRRKRTGAAKYVVPSEDEFGITASERSEDNSVNRVVEGRATINGKRSANGRKTKRDNGGGSDACKKKDSSSGRGRPRRRPRLADLSDSDDSNECIEITDDGVDDRITAKRNKQPTKQSKRAKKIHLSDSDYEDLVDDDEPMKAEESPPQTMTTRRSRAVVSYAHQQLDDHLEDDDYADNGSNFMF